MNKAKNIRDYDSSAIARRLDDMEERTAGYLQRAGSLHVQISAGNAKTGTLVPSVSLRPVLDCGGNCGYCCRRCYDIRNCCRVKEVRAARARNAAILQADRERYFREIEDYCRTCAGFRWHIGGDIVDADYFRRMCRVARACHRCQFLVFTKQYSVVNSHRAAGHRIPRNLRVIFSAWPGLIPDNPYCFPVAYALFPGRESEVPDGAKYCSGNCSECLLQGRNCFSLRRGESVVFPAH